jgi:NAD(P)-dependent dehydrogenase (short-subunit alcohol dehydrogenase family)
VTTTEPDGPVALVTGAGSGLGRAISRALLDDGHRVALAGRRAAALAETADGHPAALVIATDVTDPAAVEKLFRAVVLAWGRVDLLVNNAGTFGPSGTPDEIAVADWSACIATTLTGAFLCTREAFAVMRGQHPQGGRILNNGSVSAQVPRPRSMRYMARLPPEANVPFLTLTATTMPFIGRG